jgi:transglutaminase-like putative cysteine protease
MIKVFQAQQSSEAHWVLGMLRAAGIPAEIRTLPGGLPSLWIVQERHRGQAVDLVSRYLRGEARADAKPSWECPGCGERLEPRFTDCWNCAATRPDGL